MSSQVAITVKRKAIRYPTKQLESGMNINPCRLKALVFKNEHAYQRDGVDVQHHIYLMEKHYQ